MRDKLGRFTKGHKENNGRIFSEENRKRMSESKMGKKNPMYGGNFSEEHKSNISKSLKGRTIYWGDKISQALKGRKHIETTKKKVKCAVCEKEFYVFPCLIKSGGGKYCSNKCSSIGRRKVIIRNCKYCNKDFKTFPSSNKDFCDKICWSKWLVGKKRTPHTEETKRKIGNGNRNQKRPSISGKNHYKWIEDRTKLKRHNRRNDMAYKDWRIRVFKRDGFKCKINNKNCKGRIEAHHILGWKEFPELRYDINNGITLCHFHHPFKKEDEKKLSPYFQSIVKEMQ